MNKWTFINIVNAVINHAKSTVFKLLSLIPLKSSNHPRVSPTIPKPKWGEITSSQWNPNQGVWSPATSAAGKSKRKTTDKKPASFDLKFEPKRYPEMPMQKKLRGVVIFRKPSSPDNLVNETKIEEIV